jgi:hypothetical protein
VRDPQTNTLQHELADLRSDVESYGDCLAMGRGEVLKVPRARNA